MQEVNLALSDACAGGILCTAQQALCVPDVWPQTHTRTPAVLCSEEEVGRGRQGRQGGIREDVLGAACVSKDEPRDSSKMLLQQQAPPGLVVHCMLENPNGRS